MINPHTGEGYWRPRAWADKELRRALTAIDPDTTQGHHTNYTEASMASVFAGALRHARAITAIAASEWMSTGLDPRPGMEFWGYGWEEDRTAIPAELSAVGKIG